MFVITTYIINENGPTNITQVVRSRTLDFYYTSELTFVMEPLDLIVSNGLQSVSHTVGWQANFEAVPEPSGVALSLAGLAALAFFRCPRVRKMRGRRMKPQRGRGGRRNAEVFNHGWTRMDTDAE